MSYGEAFGKYWFQVLSLFTSVLSVGFAVGTVRAEADVNVTEAKEGKVVRLGALTLLGCADADQGYISNVQAAPVFFEKLLVSSKKEKDTRDKMHNTYRCAETMLRLGAFIAWKR